jgi:2-succinyl-6-hydroxy-2,4-cyclohexadiene-1-carboxylate synthase
MAGEPRLAVERRGSGPPLVLLHGFTLTGRCWGPHVDALARPPGPDDDPGAHPYELVAVDSPGHGGSSDVRADLWESADLAVAAAGPGTYLGYSMGARLALHCALAHPDRVERLVLISGTPGIEDDAEREARRRSDDALADRIEDIGVSAFLDEWLALPMFAGLGPRDQDRAERERNTAAGLASSLRQAGTGTQRPLWSRLGELTMPVLVLSGSLDAKFEAIAVRMADELPNARRISVGCGHTVHREASWFTEIVSGWLHDTAG